MSTPPVPTFTLAYQSTQLPPTQVFAFDGAASVTQSDMTNFPTDGLTLSFWVNTTQSDAKAVLFTYDQGTDNSRRLYLRNPTSLEIGFGASSTGPTGLAIHDGRWHQVAITVSPADRTHYRVRVYVDGFLGYQSLGAVSFAAGQGLETGGALVLGRGDGSSNEVNFDGAMSELRLWSGIRSADQIVTQMEERLTGSEPGLLLHWALEDAQTSGTIVGGGFVASTLQFRQNALFVTVTDFTADGTYTARIEQLDGERSVSTTSFSESPHAIASPTIHRALSIRLKVSVAGEESAYSPAQQLVALNLGPASPRPFTYTQSPESLTAAWSAVDQAPQYQLTLVQDGTPQTPTQQSGTTLDMTAQLTSNSVWGLIVQGLSDVNFGPANTPAPLTAPALEFEFVGDGGSSGTLDASWAAVTGAEAYYLEVYKRTATQPETWSKVYSTWVTSTSVSITAAEVPTAEGEVFKARVRPLGGASVGAWSPEQQVTIVQLARPILGWQWDGVAHTLAVTWDEVSPGATYRLRIFQDGGTTPIVDQSGLTTRSRDVTSYLSQAHVYTIKVNATKDGSQGPANTVETPPALAPTFIYDNVTGQLAARWTSAPNVYLSVTQGAGAADQQFFDAATTTYSVPPPNGGFVEGTQYDLAIRGLAQGTIADPTQTSTTIHNLAAPVVTFGYTESPEALTASWDDIRTQAQKDAGLEVTYRVVITIGGAAQAPVEQSTRTFDMTTWLAMSQSAVVTIQVTGLAQGSSGRPSTIVQPGDIPLALTYDDDTGALTASWTAGVPVYLQVHKQGAETQVVKHYAPARDTSYVVSPPGGIQVGDVWICKAKSLPEGSISAPQQAQATVLDLAAPTLAFDDAAGLAVTWGDIRTQAQKDAGLAVTYTAFLYRGTTLIDTTPDIPNTDAGRRYAVNVDWSASETYTAKVRGVAQGTLGRTSTPPAVGAATVSAPTFAVSTSQVHASWSAATGATLYHLRLVKVSGSAVVHEETLSGTDSTFTISATTGEELAAQVRSLGGGFITTPAAGAATLTTYPNMVAPVPNTPVIDVAGGSVSMSWSFDDSLYPADSVTYHATLSGAATASQDVSAKSVAFTGLDVTAGDAFTVTVQARARGSQGPTASAQATASAPPKVTGVSASSDTSSVIDVRWNSVGVGGATYTVRITGPSSYDRSFSGGTGTSVSLSQSTTRVEGGKTYSVTVAATANNLTGPASDASSVTVGQTQPVGPGGQTNNPSSGDPINLATGTFSYDDVGLAFARSSALIFRVYYNTYTPIHAENPFYDGKPMGNRWNHSLNTRLSIDTTNKKLYLLWGHGRVDVFTIPSSVTGPYTMDGVYNGTTLSLGADLVYTVTERDGTRHLFDTSGQRTRTISLIGNTVSYTYAGGRLHRATDDASGRWFELSYDGDGRVQGVTDSAGRSISYHYTNGDLTSSVDARGSTRLYTYWTDRGLGGLSLLKTATDQNNHVFLYNEYTASTSGDKTIYRVTFQQDANAWAAAPAGSPGAYGISIDYQELRADGQDLVQATVVDGMGFQSVYRSVKANGNMLTELTTLTGGAIRKVTHTYDAFNSRLTDTAYEGPADLEPTRVGNTVTNTYDSDLNLLTVSYPAPIGQVRACTYNDANQLLTDTDHLGNTTIYAYYGDGTLHTITDPLGRITRFTYYPGPIKGLVETVTGPLGEVTTYTYQGDLVHTVTGPDNSKITYGHNDLTQTTSEELRDAQGNLVRTRSYAYNVMDFREQAAVMFAGQPAAQAYTTVDTPTPLNQLSSRTDARGNTTGYTYWPGLQLHTITYPLASGIQSVTTCGYDRNNNLASVRLSPTVVTGYTWDAVGRQVSHTDPNTSTWTITYGMLFSGAAPYPTTVTTTWPPPRQGDPTVTEVVVKDVLGRVLATTDRATKTTTLTWTTRADPATGTTQQVLTTTFPQADPDDPATQYTTEQVFDALGRLVSITNEARKTSTITYVDDAQAHQQVVTSTDPLGHKLILTLDPRQRVVKQVVGKDRLTRETRYQYDPLDRLTQVVEVTANGDVQTLYTFSYDPNSQQVRMSITAPGAAAGHVLSYDGLGHIVADTDPAGHAITYGYHPRGLLHTVTRANGTSLTYDFDDAGRFHKLTFTDNTVLTQVLDANGNRTSTTLAGQTVLTRTFDAWNRLRTRTDARGAVVGSTWTVLDDLDTLTYPDGGAAPRTVQYVHDNLRRIKRVTDWATRVTRYTYTPTGQLFTAQYPNGCATTFHVDDANRFTGLTNTGPVPGGGTQVLSATSYILNALGQVDVAEELLPIAPQTAASSTSLTYNDSSELATIDGQSLTYDDAGNTTSLPGVAVIEHDDYNLLTRYGADQYGYDADALRETATVGGVTTRYIQFPGAYQAPWLDQADPSRAILRASTIRDLAGTLGLSPAFAGDIEPVPFARSLPRLLQTTDAQGQALARFIHGVGLLAHETAGGDYRLYLFDPNGNTVALTDAQGQVIGRFAYTPFGELAAQDGEVPPFLFNGRDGVLTDANGLCDMRARRYRPAQLRFLERDFLLGDLHVPQSLNPYAYVIGDPLQLVDPLGLNHSTGWWIGVGIGIGAGVGAVVGGIVGGISGGLSGGVAGAIGGALGGIIGGAIGGGVGGAVGGVVGGTVGAGVGGGLSGGLTATRIGSSVAQGLIRASRFFNSQRLYNAGSFLRGVPRGYNAASSVELSASEDLPSTAIELVNL
ncbi:LamG-like jellyroll fold domain-containing protein [Sorangium sp. So ce128]|uniref:LamG-like jellyroll fold domain-containing protein n=1 Tax=Sorangium sp. So ce128 TaxID=3133281 RepID=UPI003F5EA4D3